MIDRRVRALLVVDLALLVAVGLSSLRDTTPAPIDFGLPALDATTALRITRTGQPPVELVRADGGWTVEGDPLDAYALDALEVALAGPVGADLAIDAAGEALDDYGLGEHALTVTVSGAGAPAAPVRIGRVVDGRRTFAWPVGGDRIYRLRGDLGRVFDRPAEHWADRRLIPVELDALVSLEMRRGAALEWSAARAAPDAPWILTHPPELLAGQDEVGAVANTLATARAEGFAPADGFRPERRLEASTVDGRRFAVELQPEGDGRMRARVPGRRRLARLPRHLAVFLDAGASDLRERRVFDPAVTADGVRAVVVGEPHALRLARGDDGRWRMSAPRQAGPLPDAAAEWISALVGLRAVGFADRPPADAFAAPWRIDLDVGGRQHTLEVGAAFGNGGRLARRPDRPQRVMVLGASALETLRPAPARLLGESGAE